ncbi:glycosyltransferase [Nodosilinea sp. FACHB-131]|nr:glycosyltransferase [Nodosilinea sp. FACHB-131]
MQVFFYTRYFSPDLKYIMSEGTKKSLHGLCTGMAACGVDVTLLCEGSSGYVHEMPERYVIRSFKQNEKQKKLFLPLALKKFIAENLDANTPIFLSGIFQPKIYLLSRFLKRHHIPYIYVPHDPYAPSIFSKNAHLKWPYWLLCERLLLKNASAVQVLDPRHETYLRNLNIRTPVVSVPNGFSENDVVDESSLTWQCNDVPQLYFLGRFDAHNKGLDLLLRAFAQILPKSPAHLTLQGVDKGDKFLLEKLARTLSIQDHVTFLAPDYNLPSSSLIQQYDIFCLPSRFEGFGLSALEAMVSARVLLVSNVAGIAPHVESAKCGVTVEPTVPAISKGLSKLFEQNNQWKAMGLAGRSYASSNLQWKCIAQKAMHDYQWSV